MVDMKLDKVVATTRTELGSYDANIGSGDVPETVKLEIRTAAKKVYQNGVERISSTDDVLTGNNFAGITSQRGTVRGDNFLSESVDAPPAGGAAQVIIVSDFLRWFEPALAYADDGLIVGYYTSPVIGTGKADVNGNSDPRRPRDLPRGMKGWVLLYDHGDTMEYKVLAEPEVHASMPITSRKLRTTLSDECRARMSERGEGKIDRR